MDQQRPQAVRRSDLHRMSLTRCGLDRNHDIAEWNRGAIALSQDRREKCRAVLDLRKREHIGRLILAAKIPIQLMDRLVIGEGYRELSGFQAKEPEESLRVAADSGDKRARVLGIAAEIDAHA